MSTQAPLDLDELTQLQPTAQMLRRLYGWMIAEARETPAVRRAFLAWANDHTERAHHGALYITDHAHALRHGVSPVTTTTAH